MNAGTRTGETQGPHVKPAPYKPLNTLQSRYREMPSLPARCLLLAPSGAGGSTWMQWSILDGYDRKFQRIYVYSPTVHVDKETWDPVKAYCRRVLKIPEEEMSECFQDTFNEAHIQRVLRDQEAITSHMKRKSRPPWHVALYIDDFADEPAIARGQLLTSLFVKARHFFVSTFVKTQAFRLLGTSIRKNALSIFVWRLRGSELSTLLDELENTHHEGRKGVLRLYNLATAVEFGFLYIDVTAPPSQMFHANFKELALTDG